MNPEQKLIKKLKESPNYIEKVVGTNLERIYDLEKDVDETTKDNLKNLEQIVNLSSEIIKTNDTIIKLNNRINKLEELLLKTNELVRLQNKVKKEE